MKENSLDNPSSPMKIKKATIAALAATGMGARKIGKAIGMSYPGVEHHLRDEEVKEIIARTRESLYDADTLQAVIEGFKAPIRNYLKEDDRQLKEHGHKNILAVLQSLGALSSQTQSIYVEQINNNNSNNLSVTLNQILEEVNKRDLSGKNLFDVSPEE